jgi:hypothetical protein
MNDDQFEAIRVRAAERRRRNAAEKKEAEMLTASGKKTVMSDEEFERRWKANQDARRAELAKLKRG